MILHPLPAQEKSTWRRLSVYPTFSLQGQILLLPPQLLSPTPPSAEVCLRIPEIAAQEGISLLIDSAHCLARLLNVAALVLSKCGHVTRIISSLHGATNTAPGQANTSVFSDREPAATLKCLRVLARQAAQADLEMDKLLGTNRNPLRRYFWTPPSPGKSMAELQKQLQELGEHFTKATARSPVERQEIALMQSRIVAMSSAAAQHQILAESAVKAVTKFQMQTTKIIRYLERN